MCVRGSAVLMCTIVFVPLMAHHARGGAYKFWACSFVGLISPFQSIAGQETDGLPEATGDAQVKTEGSSKDAGATGGRTDTAELTRRGARALIVTLHSVTETLLIRQPPTQTR